MDASPCRPPEPRRTKSTQFDDPWNDRSHSPFHEYHVAQLSQEMLPSLLLASCSCHKMVDVDPQRARSFRTRRRSGDRRDEAESPLGMARALPQPRTVKEHTMKKRLLDLIVAVVLAYGAYQAVIFKVSAAGCAGGCE